MSDDQLISVMVASTRARWAGALREYITEHARHVLLLRDHFATADHDLDRMQWDVLVIEAGHSLLEVSVRFHTASNTQLVIGVADSHDPHSAGRLHQAGVEHVVSDADPPDRIAKRILEVVDHRRQFDRLVAEHTPTAGEDDQAHADRPLGAITAVTGPTRGSGATEVAVGLTAAAHHQHRSALLVDLDTVNPHVAQRCGVGWDRPSVLHAMDAVIRGNGAVTAALHPVAGVGRLVTGIENPQHYRRLIVAEVDTLLAALRRRWQQVIVRIDGRLEHDPDGRTGIAQTVVAAADRIVLVAGVNPSSVTTVGRWATTAQDHISVGRVQVAGNRTMRGDPVDEWAGEIMRILRCPQPRGLPHDPLVAAAAWHQRAVGGGRWAKAVQRLHRQATIPGSAEVPVWRAGDLPALERP